MMVSVLEWHAIFVPEDDHEDGGRMCEVAFVTSRYFPATYDSPAEGGEVEIYGLRDAMTKMPLTMNEAMEETVLVSIREMPVEDHDDWGYADGLDW